MTLIADMMTTIVSVVLILLLLVAVWLYMRWSQRNIEANTKRIKQYQHLSDETASGGPPGTVGPGIPSGDIDAQGESEDRIRELLAQLDQRVATVQQLLRAADERIARLGQAVERPGQAQTPPDTKGR